MYKFPRVEQEVAHQNPKHDGCPNDRDQGEYHRSQLAIASQVCFADICKLHHLPLLHWMNDEWCNKD